MKMTVSEKDTDITIHLADECTIYDTATLYDQFRKVIYDNRRVFVDFSKLTEMDTAAFQLLIAVKKERRSVTFTHHTPPILRCIDLYGLAGYFGDTIRITHAEKKMFSFAYGKDRKGAVNES